MSLVLENLLTVVSDNLLVDGLLFGFQCQYNYDRKEYVSINQTVTTTVGRASWEFEETGAKFLAISVDGVVYSQTFNFGTQQDCDDLKAWLLSLGIGTSIAVTREINPRVGMSVMIKISCSSENGIQYDIQGDFPGNITLKAECQIEKVVKDCCSGYGWYYVVIVDEVEYWLRADDVVEAKVINSPFLGRPFYYEKIAAQWPDKEEKDMLHPEENKILERANRVIDPKMR